MEKLADKGRQQHAKNQACVHQSEDERLAIMRRFAEAVDLRHKALGHSSDDQGGEAKQLNAAQRPVNQRMRMIRECSA